MFDIQVSHALNRISSSCEQLIVNLQNICSLVSSQMENVINKKKRHLDYLKENLTSLETDVKECE